MKVKMDVLYCLEVRMQRHRQQGRHVMIVGDFNIAPEPLDHCNPDPNFFGRCDRKWMRAWLTPSNQEPGTSSRCRPVTGSLDKSSELAEGSSHQSAPATVYMQEGRRVCECENVRSHSDACGARTLSRGSFFDTFRWFHPDAQNAYSCWNTASGARNNNWGTRIDLILVANPMTSTPCNLVKVLCRREGDDGCLGGTSTCLSQQWKWQDIMREADIQHDLLGSDHAPVWLEFDANELADLNQCSASTQRVIPGSSRHLFKGGTQTCIWKLWLKTTTKSCPGAALTVSSLDDGDLMAGILMYIMMISSDSLHFHSLTIEGNGLE
jgi:exonuclease III